MANASKTYDVFVSHAPGDTVLALEVASVCRANRLEPLTNGELLPGVKGSDILWEALSESRALLVIFSAVEPTSSMLFELGAARAWNKPIFAIVTDPSVSRLPKAVGDIPVYTLGRIDEIIQAIKETAQLLSETDRLSLAEVYTKTGLSVDQITLRPQYLDKIAKGFRSRTGKSVSGETLLSELLRMRKRGALTKSHPTTVAKPVSSTA